MAPEPSQKDNKRKRDRLPVTLLGGFLGAGKTTLLKHILETKHVEDFKIAVIVNDMAELNIDKAFIDNTGLIQSEEVISMQNGCVCCTLKSDLLEQIIQLASKGTFDYMIVEASGVSEPAQVAQLFADCEDDHDHDEEHKDKVVLADVARLDTCVTVVDAADFFHKMDEVGASDGPDKGKNFPQLMVEQIEYSNVILLNKTDLVGKDQLSQIQDQVQVLNSKATIFPCRNGAIDVVNVLDTNLYKASDFSLETIVDEIQEAMPPCCKASKDRGEPPCCKRSRTVESDKSQVLLASKRAPKTRHQSKYGIVSFLYKARRPFHPIRFNRDFVDQHFVFVEREVDDDEEEEEEGEDDEGETQEGEEQKKDASDPEMDSKKKDAEEKDAHGTRDKDQQIDTSEKESEGSNKDEEENDVKRLQKEGAAKKKLRMESIGNVMRCKGFIWMANTHDMQGFFNQAGNTVTIESPGCWKVLDAKAWTGKEEEKALLRKDWVNPFGDRRQELVFIGQELKHKAIQDLLDSCLLTDEELELGVDGWKATMGDVFLSSDDLEEDDSMEAENSSS